MTRTFTYKLTKQMLLDWRRLRPFLCTKQKLCAFMITINEGKSDNGKEMNIKNKSFNYRPDHTGWHTKRRAIESENNIKCCSCWLKLIHIFTFIYTTHFNYIRNCTNVIYKELNVEIHAI